MALHEAIRNVVQQAGRECRNQADYQRSFGLSQPAVSRLLAAVRLKDPLAALRAMPGSTGLRRMLRFAERAGVDRGSVQRASMALEQLARLMEREIGGRAELDALLTAWLPEARERFQSSQKQTIFKAMSNLKGVLLELNLVNVLLWPSADPEWHDAASIEIRHGLRRLRPGMPLRFLSMFFKPEEQIAPTRRTLDGKPLDPRRGPALLEPYCSVPLPNVRVEQEGDRLTYVLEERGIGLASAVDLVDCEVFLRSYVGFDPGDGRLRGGGAIVELPTRTLIVDVLLHENVWPAAQPKLLVYDTHVRGVADPNDPSRDCDRLEVAETVQDMGVGVERFRVPEVAEYVNMISDACTKLGWDGSKFRGYRCRIEYPLSGSQVLIQFVPPRPPRGSQAR